MRTLIGLKDLLELGLGNVVKGGIASPGNEPGNLIFSLCPHIHHILLPVEMIIAISNPSNEN